jgi:hypothetical protein
MIEFVSSGNLSIEKAYIHPIWADIHLHPAINKLSLLYIYDIENEREFVINISNIDTHTTTLDKISLDLKESVVVDKKSFLNIMDIPSMYDADLFSYLSINKQLQRNDTSAHTHFQRKFYNLKWVNNLIPISKHIQYIRETRDEFLQYYDVEGGITEGVKKFDNFYIKSLHKVEKSGFFTNGGMEWTQYHPYTLTSRPSNTFGGINYAALNKEDGSRDRFVSRFKGGRLVQFDYDGYHPRIIGKMVGEPIPTTISAHQALAHMYGVSYEESKGITFRQLYGGVQPQYLHIPLFKKVSHQIDLLWMEFNRRGYIQTPMGRKLSKSNLTDMNSNKLFNYLLQATETELNMKILLKVVEFLEGKESKMVLYTYDSFLFDIHPNEINVLEDLKILIEGNDFPTKVEWGETYSKLSHIDI